MNEEELELKLRERINDVLETEQEEVTRESLNNLEKRLIYTQNKRRLFATLKIAATVLIFIAVVISVMLLNTKYSDETKQAALHENNKHEKASEVLQDDKIRSDEQLASGDQRGNDKINFSRKITPEINAWRKMAATAIDILNSDNSIRLSENEILAKNRTNTITNANIAVTNLESIVKAADTIQISAAIKSIAKQKLPVNHFESDRPHTPVYYAKNVLRFGANVSSIVNYDQANHNSQFNVGVGIFVEIPLHDDLFIYSGLHLTNQTINFQYVNEQTLALGKHVSSKDLKLMGFDIPLNLKYRFRVAGTRVFFAAGTSSLTFVKENIETKYAVNRTIETVSQGGIPFMQTVSKEELETNSLGSFNDFFFAKVLNFSFGVELPLNSRNVLLIEPYLKYSAGPLKSVKAYPSMFGVNLGVIF